MPVLEVVVVVSAREEEGTDGHQTAPKRSNTALA